MEDKPGKLLSKSIQGLTPQDREDVEVQVANIFARLQSAPLPKSVHSFGGLTIANIEASGDFATDEAGDIVSGKMDGFWSNAGPWRNYGGYWKARLEHELEKAEECQIQGWRPVREIRIRIDTFLRSNIERQLVDRGVDTKERVLVYPKLSECLLQRMHCGLVFSITYKASHAVAAPGNVLFNEKTNKVTGLINFGSCAVLPSIHQSLMSATGGRTQTHRDRASCAEEKGSNARCFEPGKLFEATMVRRGATVSDGMPIPIPGGSTLTKMVRLEQALLPQKIVELTRSYHPPEEIVKACHRAVKALSESLGGFDF